MEGKGAFWLMSSKMDFLLYFYSERSCTRSSANVYFCGEEQVFTLVSFL